MKFIINKLVPIFTVLCILLLAGCSDVFSSLANEEGGLVITVLGEKAATRTLYPKTTPVFTKYVLEFEGPAGAEQEDITIEQGETSATVSDLAAGQWIVTAKGYVDINGTECVAAEGSATVTVGGGSSTQYLNIPIKALLGPDTGDFTYDIKFPQTVETAQLRIALFGEDPSQGTTVNLLTDGSEGTIPLPAGYYQMFIELNTGSQIAGRTEIVHIYSNMETIADYTITDGDFTTPTAIAPLPAGTWINGNITTAYAEDWYSIEVTNGTTYNIWWNDQFQGDGSKTLDIDVNAYGNGNRIFEYDADSAWNDPKPFAASYSGTVYLRVRNYGGNSGTGTYSIAYSTGSNKPNPYVSGSLAYELYQLKTEAEEGGIHELDLEDDESITPQSLDFQGKTVIITLKADAEQIITLSNTGGVKGSLFTIGQGVTLILGDNVILRGHNSNNAPLIKVNAGGTFIMEGGEISANRISTYNGDGGGVYVNENGTFTMTGGEISGNIIGDGGNGGGVYVNNGTFTMTGGDISGNTAGYGGGVYVNNSGTFTMSDGEISDNTSRSGGGVYVNNGTFDMSNTAIISGNTNSLSSEGGGVYVNENGTFTMLGGEISGNKNSNGGGVYVGGTFDMSDGLIIGNIIEGGRGGGVYVLNGGIFTMAGGEISGNITTTYYGEGGGVYLGRDAIFTLEDGEISGHTGFRNGGGVFVNIEWDGFPNAGGTFTMKGGKISGNTNTADDGGGVLVYGTFIMEDGEISGNSAHSGGGVAVRNNGTFTMEGGEIFGNAASNSSGSASSGGGVYVNNGTFTMSGGDIFGNTAIGGTGGGVCVALGSSTSSYPSVFTKTGGTITGYASDTATGNKVERSGTVPSNGGHAVDVRGTKNSTEAIIGRMENTAGPLVNLAFSGDVVTHTISGDWDYKEQL